MNNFEESAKAIESDYRFAPVGLACATFWGSSLTASFTAFLMSTGVAKGFFTTTISGGERVVFANDVTGLHDGMLIAAVLLILSVLMGVCGVAAVKAKKALGPLWKLMLLIPVLAIPFTVAVIVVNH